MMMTTTWIMAMDDLSRYSDDTIRYKSQAQKNKLDKLIGMVEEMKKDMAQTKMVAHTASQTAEMALNQVKSMKNILLILIK